MMLAQRAYDSVHNGYTQWHPLHPSHQRLLNSNTTMLYYLHPRKIKLREILKAADSELKNLIMQ